MKNLLLLFSALTFMLTSCSSDDSSTDSNAQTALKPTKIVFLNSHNSVLYVTDIKYDGNKIISSTDDDGYVFKYTYTGDVITKVETFEEFTVPKYIREYKYLDGKLSVETERKPNETKYYERKYTHHTDGVITYDDKIINPIAGETMGGGYERYTYKNGNIIKREGIGSKGEVVYTTLFEYDTKKNPMSNVLGLNFLFNVAPSLNNVTKISSSGGQEMYSYSYNSDGLPSEIKRYGFDGEVAVIEQYTY